MIKNKEVNMDNIKDLLGDSVEEFNVNDVPTKQYLYDINQSLFEMKQLQKIMAQNLCSLINISEGKSSEDKSKKVIKTISSNGIPYKKEVNVMGGSIE